MNLKIRTQTSQLQHKFKPFQKALPMLQDLSLILVLTAKAVLTGAGR